MSCVFEWFILLLQYDDFLWHILLALNKRGRLCEYFVILPIYCDVAVFTYTGSNETWLNYYLA